MKPADQPARRSYEKTLPEVSRAVFGETGVSKGLLDRVDRIEGIAVRLSIAIFISAGAGSTLGPLLVGVLFP